MLLVVILAEDQYVKEKLKNHDIQVQTISEVSPIEVQPARVLSHIYSYLGKLTKFKFNHLYLLFKNLCIIFLAFSGFYTKDF